MADVFLPSLVGKYQKAQANNATVSMYPLLVDTNIRPAGSADRAIFDRGKPGLRDKNLLVILPVLSGAGSLGIRVTGWVQSSTDMFVPEFVCEVQANVSGTLPGIAGEDVAATEYHADAITLVAGVAMLRQGLAGKTIASFAVPVPGFELVEVSFNTIGSNALCRWDAAIPGMGETVQVVSGGAAINQAMTNSLLASLGDSLRCIEAGISESASLLRRLVVAWEFCHENDIPDPQLQRY